jgi:hypothetical protein
VRPRVADHQVAVARAALAGQLRDEPAAHRPSLFQYDAAGPAVRRRRPRHEGIGDARRGRRRVVARDGHRDVLDARDCLEVVEADAGEHRWAGVPLRPVLGEEHREGCSGDLTGRRHQSALQPRFRDVGGERDQARELLLDPLPVLGDLLDRFARDPETPFDRPGVGRLPHR